MNICSGFVRIMVVRALLAAASTLVEQRVARAQSSATVGSVRGGVRDKATGEAAVGATVIATSPSLIAEQIAIAEDGGQYFLTSLPPGLYVLTVFYADAKFSRGNVLIHVGKEAATPAPTRARSLRCSRRRERSSSASG